MRSNRWDLGRPFDDDPPNHRPPPGRTHHPAARQTIPVTHIGLTAITGAPDPTLGYNDVLLDACRALRAGEWAQAEALLMRAAPLAGDDAAFLNLAGVAAEARRDLRSARAFYSRAIRTNPRFEPAQQNMRRLFELSRFGRTCQPAALGDE
jgi:tetratricopeptide (TPR) repeat protein